MLGYNYIKHKLFVDSVSTTVEIRVFQGAGRPDHIIKKMIIDTYIKFGGGVGADRNMGAKSLFSKHLEGENPHAGLFGNLYTYKIHVFCTSGTLQ